MQRTDGGVTSGFRRRISADMSADPGPTADFLQWWIFAARMYLVPADPFHRLPLDEIPVEEGGDTAPTQQTQGGASTSQAVEDAGTSSQAYLPSTPQTQGTAIPSRMSSLLQQAFLDGLSSLGFQQMISDIMLEGSGGYRPDTQSDGSQVHLDLKEHVSSP
ncbi:hypothetical protein PIB30_026327 [Stylosanthes scabra]|uniref:Uncharacterized protein n=1 Tax=Stylosanthes scabra TaxID=79078 RepID=A0ABU6XBW0_9FABA|nr:hypothetical protein [Stylosanthes scabra]